MPRKRNKPSWRQLDPQFGQEKTRYDSPIPSREFILHHLQKRGVLLTHEELCEEFQVDMEQEAEPLRRRLRAMERDGQLVRNRREGYGIPKKMDLIKGRVLGHGEGHGFLIPEDGSDNLFISPRDMRQLMHGDIAMMRIDGLDNRGRREAALVEVLERNTRQAVGRFSEKSGIAYVAPDNRRINQDILIPPEHRGEAKSGEIVVVELIVQPSKQNPPIGRIREVLGNQMAPGMEVQIAIASYDIPTEWPEDVIQEANDFGETVPEPPKRDRLDLRDTPLVTIDGITARDFDDAVFCQKGRKNYKLIVAIADVAWYVRPGSPLNSEAEKRGTSVYFPDRVIPMLPENLSNGLCSLRPEVDRLCLACEMTISPEGEVVRYRFHEAVMCSAARLTYEAVASMVVERDERLRREHGQLASHLDTLYELFQVLRRSREQRGAMDFDTKEAAIEYGADRKIERIVPTERNDAHRMIEECMIAANVCAARFLRRHRIPALYRIHEGPSDDRLEKLLAFLGQLGLHLPGGDEPTAQDYAKLLAETRERPDAQLIQTMLLRSMQQAVYSPEKQGHFGLSLEHYTHFTSPIRRYPDLIVHRAIRHLLQGGNAKNFHYSPEDMARLGEHTSMTERRADDATRDAMEWLKCEYMQDKVGEVFDALITGVTSFGLFVELKNIFVSGLVHVTSLANDYYHFDPVSQHLRGERTGQVYRLGDALQVKLIRVDLDDRKIDFELVTQNKSRRSRSRSRGRRDKA